MRIREATVEDIPRLIELGREFFDMTELGKVTEYDPQSAGRCFMGLIESASSVVLVIEKEGTIIGGAGATIYPFYFNLGHKVAQEFFWFISEEHRGGAISIRLFNMLEAWAKEHGAETMVMIALGCNFTSVSEFYRRRGYFQQETNFMRRL